MEENKFEVIVVGAGPAGGSCARELAKKGHKVLIIDRTAEIGEPNFSTAGTPPETIKEFDLPEKVILKSWTNFQFRGPSGKFTTIKYNKIIGYTLNFRELRQFLIREAVNNEATTHIQTLATELIRDGNNKIIGVKTEGVEGKNNYFADIIIDATGTEGKFSTILGLRKTKDILPAITFEQFMTNIDLPDYGNTVYIGLGSKEIPGGYTWIFPAGRKEAKVGMAQILPYLKDKANIKEYFQKFIHNYPGFEKAEAIENHCHNGIMAKGGSPLKHYSLDNFICIGDAAAQINPLAGEGIRHFLRSGRMAAKVISEAIRKKDFSQKQLSKYDKLWRDYAEKKWKICTYLHKFIYYGSDQLLDKFIEILQDIDKKTILKIFWYYDQKAVAKGFIKLAQKRICDFKDEFLGLFK